MRGQPYTPCSLYYDSPRKVAEGDYIQTPTGTSYFVTAVRPSPTMKHRKNLKCLRWPKDAIPAGAVVHELHWYSRDKRRTVRA